MKYGRKLKEQFDFTLLREQAYHCPLSPPFLSGEKRRKKGGETWKKTDGLKIFFAIRST